MRNFFDGKIYSGFFSKIIGVVEIRKLFSIKNLVVKFFKDVNPGFHV
jgi:hypothetical protein